MGELITEHKQAAKIVLYHYKAQAVLHPRAGDDVMRHELLVKRYHHHAEDTTNTLFFHPR